MAFAFLLVGALGVGGTVAYLTAEADPVVNEFGAGAVSVVVDEVFDNLVKRDVKIQNTGSVEAYIRAAVVVNWRDEDGKVHGKAPLAGEDKDYRITFADDDADGLPGQWLEVDGLYYWSMPVEPGGETGVLISSCSPVGGRAPEGYFLNVEIIGSGVQAYGKSESGDEAVEEAWSSDRVGVEVGADRSLSITPKATPSTGEGGEDDE